MPHEWGASLDDKDVPLVVAEYNGLRQEILKRIEFLHQLTIGALIITGTFITIGVQQSSPPQIFLLYPILGFLLATQWTYNSKAIHGMGLYIRRNIEPKVKMLMWEGYLEQAFPRRTPFSSLDVLSSGGVFVVTELLTVGLGIYKLSGVGSSLDITLIILDIILIIASALLVIRRLEPLKKNQSLYSSRINESARNT